MKSKIEVYALAVCFFCVISLLFTLSFSGYAIIRITTPEITLPSYEYQRLQSNAAYWNRYSSADNAVAMPAEEELTQQRLEAYDIAVSSEARDGKQDLFQQAIFALVGSILLLIHWRIFRQLSAR
ncbi:hypothetical protein BTA51_20520 [Hahella sp. CCB-MM4]|uniref:hypothetical protein n=1 Tax=Hahella sp. (strain CCB-MM4) TaxID=1926491 RepID=UPI000B9C1161|nr:hypothetical protein [Hahella sp. CCB-MM4]OZG71340.1 hypothetical protein BTA51_20520 [Hahella sp. CCB-MM4]